MVRTTLFIATTLVVLHGCASCSDGTQQDAATNGSTNQNPNIAPNGTTVDPSDTDGDGIPNDEEESRGTDPDDPDSDGDGFLDGSESTVGSDPLAPDEPCGLDEHVAHAENRPVDIIFVIDDSSSMGDEIRSVEENVNVNFANIIRDSGVDFRVIMISAHAAEEDHQICVSTPLSGTSCDPKPERPINTERFFHYDIGVDSNDSLALIVSTYNEPDMHGFTQSGWSEWLREDAFKVFIEITDDDSEDELPNGDAPTAENFESALFALQPSHFGTPGFRNYVFHAIVGLAENSPPEAPYQPDAPLVDDECDTSSGQGTEYQRLAKVTGGLRYPVCRFQNYDLVFEEAARGVIQQAKIGCSLAVPDPPPGEFIDKDAIILEYQPDDGADRQQVTRVERASDCASRNFYVSGNTIQLCPDLCAEVGASDSARLWVLAGCKASDDTCTPSGTSELLCDDGIDNDCDGFVDRADVECIL